MRKQWNRAAALLLAAVLLLTLCACGKKPVQPEQPEDPVVTPEQPETPAEPVTPEQPETPEVPVPVTVDALSAQKTVAAEDGATLLEYTLSYPQTEGLEQVSAYYQALEQRRQAEMDSYEAQLPQLRQEMETEGMPFFPYSFEADYSVLRNDGVLLSILRTNEDFTGGIHPQYSYSAETFLVAEQQLLTLDAMFSVPEEQYLPVILEEIRRAMDENEQQAGVAIYFDDARDSLADLLDPSHFAVDGTGLVFFFEEYTLAPYAEGLQQFHLKAAEHLDILNGAWFFA